MSLWRWDSEAHALGREELTTIPLVYSFHLCTRLRPCYFLGERELMTTFVEVMFRFVHSFNKPSWPGPGLRPPTKDLDFVPLREGSRIYSQI